MMTFLEVMNLPPAKPAAMPLMDPPAIDPAQAWLNAVNGVTTEHLFSDTRASMSQWLSQPFGSAAEMDAKITTGKA